MEKATAKKNTRTYCRRDLGESGEKKPSETLYEWKFRLLNWMYRSQQEVPPPHLIPENASQTKLAHFEAHAEQANEHDEK